MGERAKPAGAPSARVIAQYFPQLHPIKENDAWWGAGFTDWVNVKRGRPLFRGHHQPRVPLGGNYYDQSRESVVRAQVDLARDSGIYGFAHYHYWFDGRQLLETPTNLFLGARDIDFKFCLAWANETWSRRWDGQDHFILIEQTHPPDKERWELHFRYLIKAWTDERSIRVDGKPMFLIYRPLRISQIGQMLDYWRTRALSYGLPGLYFVCMNQYQPPPPHVLRCFDAMMLFQPFVSMYRLIERQKPRWKKHLHGLRARLPERYGRPLRYWMEELGGPTVVDYDEVWREIVARPSDGGTVTLPGAFVDWDNTARYRRRATLFSGATPDRFEFWMRRLLGAVSENREQERFIFVNAWNEWAEGAYLEPDERNGYLFLDALRKALGVEPRRGVVPAGRASAAG
jgi:hypothetical protein